MWKGGRQHQPVAGLAQATLAVQAIDPTVARAQGTGVKQALERSDSAL
jgi:hypothetical protein